MPPFSRANGAAACGFSSSPAPAGVENVLNFDALGRHAVDDAIAIVPGDVRAEACAGDRDADQGELAQQVAGPLDLGEHVPGRLRVSLGQEAVDAADGRDRAPREGDVRHARF